MKTIRLDNISKYFANKVVLKKVSLVLKQGTIHTLLGENGAGKTTLASILCGKQKPSSGQIYVENKLSSFSSPLDALEKGISIVHQRPVFVDNLTLWENIVLGFEPVHSPKILGLINRKKAFKDISLLLKKYNIGLNLDITKKAYGLGADGIFFISFLAALYQNPKFLLLDEPCAALDEIQRKNFYSSLKKLTANGLGILIITHNISEALEYSDLVSVLKKGELVYHGIPEEKEVNKALFPVSTFSERKNISFKTSKTPIFSVTDLFARPKFGPALFNLSFSVYGGEICLIKGQQESGMNTLENIITGMYDDKCQGVFSFGTEKPIAIQKITPQIIRRFGTGIIPFNRVFRGSNPDLMVEEVAGIYEAPSKIKNVAEKIIADANISISLTEKASNLSGGMLQRLILARELFYNPKFLILTEPFQGLDRVASISLIEKLLSVAKSGTGVLVLAAECFSLPEYSSSMFSLVGGKLQTFCKEDVPLC